MGTSVQNRKAKDFQWDRKGNSPKKRSMVPVPCRPHPVSNMIPGNSAVLLCSMVKLQSISTAYTMMQLCGIRSAERSLMSSRDFPENGQSINRCKPQSSPTFASTKTSNHLLWASPLFLSIKGCFATSCHDPPCWNSCFNPASLLLSLSWEPLHLCNFLCHDH